MNTYGTTLRLTTFGESHGKAMGGVLDGFPPGVRLTFEPMRAMLARRRPGSSRLVTSRREDDEPVFLSGFSEDGVTLGTPIGFMVENRNQRSSDYETLRTLHRPNHADLTTEARYGLRDYRGGGRASARETVSWVVAGGLAAEWLGGRGITVKADLVRINGIDLAGHGNKEERIAEIIAEARRRRDSVGGVVECRVSGVRLGEAGNPVFGKLHASLAQGMMSINGVHGFEYGMGFEMADRFGSEVADRYGLPDRLSESPLPGSPIPLTNHSGGIQGGISNGNDICLRVAFKPTPTIGLPLDCYRTGGEVVRTEIGGRHDPCIAIRGVVVVEAMAALTIADQILSTPSIR